jgi:multisubunit Na+/H+ antiporter MnhG subunit
VQAKDKKINPDKCRDSGLALVLISLICYQVSKLSFLIPLGIGLLLVAMIYPPVFKPFARFWYGLSVVLGNIVSRLILSIVFFLIIYPVALLRKLLGKDSMQIKNWKKGSGSVFRQRNHRYERKDLEYPY